MKTLSAHLLLLGAAALFVGCGGAEHDPNMEACEALEMAHNEVTAGATADTTAPAVEAGHMAYHVALTGGAEGFVRTTIAEAGHYLIFLGEDLDVEVLAEDGTPATGGVTSDAHACDGIHQQHLIDLDIGVYYVGIGPVTADAEVALVMSHHDEGGHTDTH